MAMRLAVEFGFAFASGRSVCSSSRRSPSMQRNLNRIPNAADFRIDRQPTRGHRQPPLPLMARLRLSARRRCRATVTSTRCFSTPAGLPSISTRTGVQIPTLKWFLNPSSTRPIFGSAVESAAIDEIETTAAIAADKRDDECELARDQIEKCRALSHRASSGVRRRAKSFHGFPASSQ